MENTFSEITVGYVEVEDLLQNGGMDCELLKEKPQRDYVVVLKDEIYCAYRGRNLVRYHGEKIAGEWRLQPMQNQLEAKEPTVGLLDDAAEVIRGREAV